MSITFNSETSYFLENNDTRKSKSQSHTRAAKKESPVQNNKIIFKNFDDLKKYTEKELKTYAQEKGNHYLIDEWSENNKVINLYKKLSQLDTTTQKIKKKEIKSILQYLLSIIDDFESKQCSETSYQYDGTKDDNYYEYLLQRQGYNMEAVSSIRGTKLDGTKW